MLTNEERLAFIECAIAIFDLLWLRAWHDLVSLEITPDEQLTGCKLLLQISTRRARWLEKRQEWHQKRVE